MMGRWVKAEFSESLHMRFRVACIRRGMPIPEAMRQAVREWIKTEPEKKTHTAPTDADAV